MKTGIIKVCLVILIILSFAWIIIMVYANVNLHNDHEQNDPDYSIVPLTDLTIEKPIINLGDVPKDTVIHADFVIRNIGTNNLYITGIDPDCICTDYKISKEIVTPGEQTVIELLVDTRNKFGNNTINVVFKANTERDLYILKLNFNVNTEKEGADSVLLIKNPIVDIGEIKKNELYDFSVTLINNSANKIFLFDILTSCSCIKVTMERQIIPEYGTTELHISYLGDHVGVFSKTVGVVHSASKKPLTFRVTGTVI